MGYRKFFLFPDKRFIPEGEKLADTSSYLEAIWALSATSTNMKDQHLSMVGQKR